MACSLFAVLVVCLSEVTPPSPYAGHGPWMSPDPTPGLFFSIVLN